MRITPAPEIYPRKRKKMANDNHLFSVPCYNGNFIEKKLTYLWEKGIQSYIKLQDQDFRRFNYRSTEKVYKEFMLYAIGRDIMKYHRFLHHEIEKYEGKKEEKAA